MRLNHIEFLKVQNWWKKEKPGFTTYFFSLLLFSSASVSPARTQDRLQIASGIDIFISIPLIFIFKGMASVTQKRKCTCYCFIGSRL